MIISVERILCSPLIFSLIDRIALGPCGLFALKQGVVARQTLSCQGRCTRLALPGETRGEWPALPHCPPLPLAQSPASLSCWSSQCPSSGLSRKGGQAQVVPALQQAQPASRIPAEKEDASSPFQLELELPQFPTTTTSPLPQLPLTMPQQATQHLTFIFDEETRFAETQDVAFTFQLKEVYSCSVYVAANMDDQLSTPNSRTIRSQDVDTRRNA